MATGNAFNVICCIPTRRVFFFSFVGMSQSDKTDISLKHFCNFLGFSINYVIQMCG